MKGRGHFSHTTVTAIRRWPESGFLQSQHSAAKQGSTVGSSMGVFTKSDARQTRPIASPSDRRARFHKREVFVLLDHRREFDELVIH